MALRDPTAQEQDEGDSRNAELVASLAVDAQSTRSDRREVDRLVTPDVDQQAPIPGERGASKEVEAELLLVRVTEGESLAVRIWR